MIYLDYNGTAPLSGAVRRYLATAASDDWGNPAAEHDFGYSQKIKFQSDREAIAEILGWNPGQIVFTSGGTESINTVLNSRNLLGRGIRSVISSPLEHSATLSCLNRLESDGQEIRWLEHTSTGGYDYEHLRQLCETNPGSLVSLMHVNNETGVINDVALICGIARKYDCLVHIDGVQALGKLTCDYSNIDCDYASFSGHKIGSLKGIGILLVRDIKMLAPLVLGGSQEQSCRGGTSNAIGVRTLRLALADAMNWRPEVIGKVRDEIFSRIQSINGDVRINCEAEPRVCNTISAYFPRAIAKEILLKAGKVGFMISTGSACTSGMDKPSYVIESIYDYARAIGSIRMSIGPDSAVEGIDLFVEAISHF